MKPQIKTNETDLKENLPSYLCHLCLSVVAFCPQRQAEAYRTLDSKAGRKDEDENEENSVTGSRLLVH